MSRTPTRNYLRRHRLRTALTLRELGALLGISKSALIRYELGLRPVPAEIVIASERVFGVSGSALFPALYNGVEEDLAIRAFELHDRLAGRLDLGALKKRSLISTIESRFH